MQQKGDVTHLLEAWSGGDRTALACVLRLIDDEPRRLAPRHLGGERCGHTVQRDGAAQVWLTREVAV